MPLFLQLGEGGSAAFSGVACSLLLAPVHLRYSRELDEEWSRWDLSWDADITGGSLTHCFKMAASPGGCSEEGAGWAGAVACCSP